MDRRTALRRALRTSTNRHWFGRLVIATWTLCLPLFAFFAPDSPLAHAMAAAGEMGYLMMLALAVLALGSLTDAAIHDLLPGRLQQILMVHRHAATMVMAIVLTIEGGALSVRGQNPLLAAPFLLLTAFCVAVTFLDLYARNKERCR